MENHKIPRFVDSRKVVGTKLVTHGFNNWKVGQQALDKHEAGKEHKACYGAWQANFCREAQTNYIVAVREKELSNNRKSLEALFEAMLYLGQQGLAIRGHEHVGAIYEAHVGGNL